MYTEHGQKSLNLGECNLFSIVIRRMSVKSRPRVPDKLCVSTSSFTVLTL